MYRAATERRRLAIDAMSSGGGSGGWAMGGDVNPLLAGFYEMQLEIECAVEEGLQEDRDRLPINKIRIRL